MKGIIINYRMGRHRIYQNHIIVRFEDINDKYKAKNLIGKRIIWVSSGKKIFLGKIVDIHGNKGHVRARFRKGLPGQAIGDIVLLLEDRSKYEELKNKIKNAVDINQIRSIIINA
ncbi:50S ribosomal protein L35Ae [Nanobdella aerobiophila]|uniref:Large ribosomal subunit protein eL33 n=1 Tax=Nanobdella aerobiophila TaxID=2586965 RepID=A0A915WT10_9ARCH|nr:50S ribosomal protein L35ae [Nanobdella aerobiophila]BBL45865.1 50S ribosomal protein L35Ae [Nanobdella aerobiophila]